MIVFVNKIENIIRKWIFMSQINKNELLFEDVHSRCRNLFGSKTSVRDFENICNLHPDLKLNQKDSFGSMVAIVIAAENGNIQLLHHLVGLLGKESLNMCDPYGYTPLAVICKSIAHVEGIDREKTRFGAQALINLGADLNIRNDDEYSPLGIAARKSENVMLTALLIENGAVLGTGDRIHQHKLIPHEGSENTTLNIEQACKLLSALH